MPNRGRDRKRSSKPNHISQRSWTEFEKLVSRIEAALSPREAVVKSPDRLFDYAARTFREVDASIRYKVGTTEILIIIECRERSRTEDVLWIEQLASKQSALRAAKCIAVASSGFTISAVKKAQTLGIELRHLRRITADVISQWTPSRTWFFTYELANVDLSFGDASSTQLNGELDREVNQELSQKYYLEEPILRSKTSILRVSVSELVVNTINRVYGEMSESDKMKIEVDKEYIMSFSGPPEYYVECSRGRLDVIAVGFGIIFRSFVDYSLRSPSIFGYADHEKDLVAGIELEVVSRRSVDRKKIAIHKDLTAKSGRISISTVEDK